MPQTATGCTAQASTRALAECLTQCLIEGSFGAIVLLDLDQFREFNADQGVERGKQVLDFVEQYTNRCGWSTFRLGGDLFGVVVEKAGEPFDDEKFRRGLLAGLVQKTGRPWTFSGGGVRHPGKDFGLDPRMAGVMVTTAQQLLAIAKKAGRGRILWLPHGPVGSAETMQVMVRFYQELARISASIAHDLAIESRIDYLTGLANRRGFEDAFGRAIDGAQRSRAPLGLLYLDSDSLKRINDARGHDAGDRFIVDIARVLNQVVRGSDFVSRWGADEFAVLMDHATPKQAAALASRLQHAIETCTEGTVSIGVYCGVPETAEQAIQEADRALYRAKEDGRNRIAFAD